MALVQSKQIVAGYPVPTPTEATDVLPITAEYVVPAGGRAINDVIEFGAVPPGCVVVDAVIHNTAGGASATADVGVLSGNYGDASAATGQARTCGSEYIAAGDMNATTVKRLTKSVLAATSLSEVGWGMKVTGAVWPAAMVVRATLFVRPAPVAMA